MFRKDTARFRKSFGPGGVGPVRSPRTGTAPASDVGVGGDDAGPDPGWCEQTGLVGRVGSASRPCLPRIRPVGALVCPGRASQAAAPTGTPTEPLPAGNRRADAVGAGAAAGGVIQVLRRSPVVAVLRCGRGIPVRSHRTTVLLVRHRAVGPGCTLSEADLCPGHGAQSVAGPSPVGSGKPVGRWRCGHRRRGWSMVRQPPRSASVPPRPTRSRAPPTGPPRPAPAGPATRRRRRESGRHRWRPPR